MPNPRLPEFDENSPLRPSRFGHIVLKSARYEEMVDWYKQFLNAEPLFETPVATFLTYDDEHHRLLVAKAPNAKDRDPDAAGVMHFAYLYNDLSELMQAYARLRDVGVTPAYCVNHGFQFSLYYHDPDGNEAEFGCDNFKTRQEMNDWFEEGHFAQNIYGHEFDPEAVYEQHMQGVSDDQIYKDTYPGGPPTFLPRKNQ